MAVSSGSVIAEEPEVWNNPKNISGTVWFTLDLSYHNTDSDAKAFFGDNADSRVVFTISRTF